MSDPQSNRYMLTINNPLDKELSHEAILKSLLELKSFEYLAMADEVGEQGTPHTHVLACFSSRIRFSSMKKRFREAHIEKCRGSIQSNIDYITKSGKWENSSKHETSVEGTFFEYGVRPKDRSKGLMEDLYSMIVDEELDDAEILASNPEYIKYADKIPRVRAIHLSDKYKNTLREVDVTYISGKTGAGKTKYVFENNPSLYRVTDYEHPFDFYCSEKVVCFDEFRDSIKLKDMLMYLDIYPCMLKARYSNKYACYSKVYIVSNWQLQEQYKAEQHNDKESYKAFLRRIHHVIIFDDDGMKEYDSVTDYLKHYGD